MGCLASISTAGFGKPSEASATPSKRRFLGRRSGEIDGTSQTSHGKLGNFWTTLWWTNIAMENHHAIIGKIHYFDWAIFHCYVSSPEGSWENGWKWTKNGGFSNNPWLSGMRIYNQRTLWVVLRYEYIIVYVCNYIYISSKLGVWGCNYMYIHNIIYNIFFRTNHIMKIIMGLSLNIGKLFSQYSRYTCSFFLRRICRRWGFEKKPAAMIGDIYGSLWG